MKSIAQHTEQPIELADGTARESSGVGAEARPFKRDSLLRRMLAGADVLAVLVACATLLVTAEARHAAWAIVFLPAWILIAKLFGLYDRDHRTLRHLTVDELPTVFVWAAGGAVSTAVFLQVAPAGPIRFEAKLWLCVAAGLGALLFRSSARYLWRRVTPRERTAIVGSGPVADATRRKLELFPDIHLDVVAERDEVTAAELRGDPHWLDGLDRVILAANAIDEELIAELVARCRRARVKLSVVPPARGVFGTAVLLNHVADLPVVEYNTWDTSRSTLLLKRAIDLAAAALSLVVLSPLLLLAAAAIKLESRGPVLFAQWRAGRDGRPFRMLKFRTMVADAEDQLAELVPFDSLGDPMFKLRGDPRVTRVGHFLRRTSIDELPQLWNVLRDEMSLVGPRPEQVELVARYRPEHRFRLEVKPGLTGPMQVYGRGELTFEERLAVEREYIENLSVGRDLHILLMTVVPVATGRGAY
jgi:exopolysaccharide biosynthesis polyprenyl glycosylphosphotransferase